MCPVYCILYLNEADKVHLLRHQVHLESKVDIAHIPRSVNDSSLLSRVTILTMSLPDLCGNGNLELEEAERMVKEFKDVVDQCKKNYEENEETLSTLIIKEVEKQNNVKVKVEKKNKDKRQEKENCCMM